MRPGRRLVFGLLMVAAAALLVPFGPELVWVLAIALVVLAGLAVAESVLLGGLDFHVEVQRAIALYLDEQETVELAVTSNSTRPLKLELRQAWPRLVAETSSRAEARLEPGTMARFRFPVRGIERGEETIAPPSLRFSVWELVERRIDAATITRLSVVPNLHAVARLHRKLNQFVLRGLGMRTTPRIGKGREFDRLREYVSGDEFRDIAWKATARHGKIITREFRVERAQEIVVCLDQGHRMAERVAQMSRLDHVINAAILLAYICNRMDDKVGMVTFAPGVTASLGTARGSTHLRRITEFLTRVRPLYRHTDYPVLAADLKAKLKSRTLVVMFTMLPGEEERESMLRAVEMLQPRHLPLVVVQHDPNLQAAGDFLPGDRSELSRVIVAREMLAHRRLLIRDLRMRGALVVDTRPGEVAVDAMNAYLDVKRRQLL
jgi:uncharacterized protein (DUF58 family)